MDSIMSARDVAKYLKLSFSTIYKLAASGEIPGFKIGDSWRFEMKEVQKLIRSRKYNSK